MRELKFRAWSDRFGMYKVGCLVTEKGTWDFNPDDRSFRGVSMPYQPFFTIEQYTGIKDKNGKEIYEGDIVSKHNSDTKGVVKQVKDGQWAIYWDNVPDGYYVLFKYSDWCEVVGNIHEDSPNEEE
uniref:YopX protein n=1 Tax=Siphoviridae sp. ctAkS7 TaxID=2827798 RepID=A0A8S5SYT8_9CAUD|nr:MAG TPA: YopX protein [Siphoviridae sp. ctAkS7]